MLRADKLTFPRCSAGELMAKHKANVLRVDI